jgi:hypothetical protein
MEELRDELRHEMSSLFEENAKRIEDEIGRRCLALESSLEVRMSAERKRVEAAIKSEEELFAARNGEELIKIYYHL